MPNDRPNSALKWPVTIAAILLLLGLCFTASQWVPWLLSFVVQEKDRIEALKVLVEFGVYLLAGTGVIVTYFSKQWRRKQTSASVPHQLPQPPLAFQGRKRELRELRAAIKSGGAIISGLGGVGKTAVALKLADEISRKFPDGQVYVNLDAASERPLPCAEALSRVIHAFQPESKLPESENELGGRYRTVLHGKRALLLMDNARDAAQVKPLIPPQGCTLLVTSRLHFTLPGLVPKDLGSLPPADAHALLLSIAPRIGAHAEAIAKLCGYLPLALRLAATAIAERADMDPAAFAQRLVDEKNRPKLLAAGNESVEASISLSYGLLDPDTQKRWRMLAVSPDTFDAPAAAAVWEMEADPAQDNLSRLLQHSMLEWNAMSERYRLHDLMRDFARSRLEPAERNAAALRHSKRYADVLALADDSYLKGGDSVMRGLALFDAEWANIQTGQAWAAEHAANRGDAARLCSAYPEAGVYCLNLRQHPRERIHWLESALAAARQLKDRAAEGRNLGNLGNAYLALGEPRRAIEYYEQHLAIAREIGDRRGEGTALGNLGNAYFALGETRRAIEYYERALAIHREIGDRRGEGNALGNLGNAYFALGETRQAIQYHEQALAIDREIGDQSGEGQDLGNLGVAYFALGETRRAIELYEQQLAITCEIGDRQGEGNALGNLGNAYFALGETRRAIEYYEQRLAFARETGDRRGEGNALWNMALALDTLGQRPQAIENAQAALQIFEQIEDPNAEKVRKQLEQWKKG